MQKLSALFLVAAVLLSVHGDARSDTSMKVEWLTSFEAAMEKAAATGRPILYFQLLGRLDEEYC